jgi:tRNA (cmo5U34)-methyltransferase
MVERAIVAVNEWSTASHAGAYLDRGPEWPPHRFEGEAVMLALLPPVGSVGRILDLGTGDGRLLAALLAAHPDARGVAVDVSPTMLAAARRRFLGKPAVEVVEHNLDHPLPVDQLGRFDVIVSAFAIHHCPDERKRALYREVVGMLEPGGWFCNLEHVASPTAAIHGEFFRAIGQNVEDEDPSNKLVDVASQLGWLSDACLTDVDCYWKWRELALLAGHSA